MSNEEKKALESELNEIFNESEKLRKRRLELLSKLGEKEIDTEYNFITSDGSKKSLAELFGDQKYLFTIHNMGKHCSYCTMWADGFNDTYKYIQKKGAFVLISPDDHDTQKEFADSRGWTFMTATPDNNEFIRDMGYSMEQDGETYYLPGLSVFEKSNDGKIKRVTKEWFGPSDYYCNVWHFYDLLPEENITITS
ncbi:MAG: DUF899 family protein [Ignavibacteriae bacterium]|nr:DUF899 family protein [Ignavibacteriota bacterium]MCB9244733.1 DUF899 family protein [Ignavibacteriales bacterium]